MYNDQLIYKVVIWAYFGISLWREKVPLTRMEMRQSDMMVGMVIWGTLACQLDRALGHSKLSARMNLDMNAYWLLIKVCMEMVVPSRTKLK